MVSPAAALPAILPVVLVSVVELLSKLKHSFSYSLQVLVVFNVLSFFIFVISSVSSPASSSPTTDEEPGFVNSRSSSNCLPEKDGELTSGIVGEETSAVAPAAAEEKFVILEDEAEAPQVASSQILVEGAGREEKRETSTETTTDDKDEILDDEDTDDCGREDDVEDDLERRSEDFINRIREEWKNERQAERGLASQ